MKERRLDQEHIEVIAATHLTDRQLEDLTSFVSYCAARFARQLAITQRWIVTIGRRGRHACVCARVDTDSETITASGASLDFALAIWDAMCRVEQPLRELATQRHRRLAVEM
jgi:hypothetical protein